MQFAAFLRPICLLALGLVAGGCSLGEGAMLQQGGITFTRETEGSGAEAKAHQYVRVKRSTFSRNGQAADSRGTLVSEEYRTYALGVERNQGPLEDQIAQNLIGLRVGGKLVVRPNDARFNSYEIELLAIATIPTDTAIPELPEVVSRWATWVDRPKSGAFSGCTLAYGSSWVMVGSCLGHTFAVGPKPQQIYCRITDPYEHANVGITNCMIDGGPMPKSMVLAKQEVTPDGLKPRMDTVRKGLVDKYGPPSFQIPKVVDDLKLLWMFNAAGELIKGPCRRSPLRSGSRRRRRRLPTIRGLWLRF